MINSPPSPLSDHRCEACRANVPMLYFHGRMIVCFECREAMQKSLLSEYKHADVIDPELADLLKNDSLGG